MFSVVFVLGVVVVVIVVVGVLALFEFSFSCCLEVWFCLFQNK